MQGHCLPITFYYATLACDAASWTNYRPCLIPGAVKGLHGISRGACSHHGDGNVLRGIQTEGSPNKGRHGGSIGLLIHEIGLLSSGGILQVRLSG